MRQEVFRHRRGGVYTVLGTVSGVVYYVSHADGSLWWRPHEEFHDGRFHPCAERPLGPDEVGFMRG